MKNYNVLKNKILFRKYKIIKKIRKGAFGYVFKGINLQNNSKIAIKIEKKSSIYHLLEAECHFLSILKGYGIPEVKSYGYSYNFYYLVEELLGKNLIEINKIIKSFSLAFYNNHIIEKKIKRYYNDCYTSYRKNRIYSF